MAGWLVPRTDLTAEQIRAVELPADRHRVLSGGPGSGKTLVLLHRARHLADALRIPDGRLLVLVYTNALTAFLRAALSDLGIPAEAVRTFDDWCAGHYERYVSAERPWDHARGRPRFDLVRDGVLRDVRRHPERPPLYDAVLVDEGQDLDAHAFEILSAVSRHDTVALDPGQRIYDGGAREEEILAALGVPSRSVALLETYRCSPYVSRLASRLLRDDGAREAFLRQARAGPGEREKPLVYLARDGADELARLAAVARARLLRGERVAVLLPLRRHVDDFARGLSARGLPVEVPHRPGTPPGPFPPLDFASDSVKVMPWHSAKGLTFDAVLLPRLTRSEVFARGTSSLHRLLFVGITRATSWVYLSAVEGDELPVLHDLATGADEVVVQRYDACGAPAEDLLDDEDEPGPVLDNDSRLTAWL
jgi:superfamily I DNA/RNA helicase